MKYYKVLGAIALAGLLAAGQAQGQVAGFSFSNTSAYDSYYSTPWTNPGTSTYEDHSFDVKSDSGQLVTATFSSLLSAGSQFQAYDNGGNPIGVGPISGMMIDGGRLGDTFDLGKGPSSLTIHFDTLVTGFSFDFVTEALVGTGLPAPGDYAAVAQSLHVEAVGAGSWVVDAQGLTPHFFDPYGYYYQGSIAEAPSTAFDTLILSVDPGPDQSWGGFGLDNLNLTLYKPGGQVPEPGALALLVGAGLPLAWRLRRRVA